MGRQISSFHDQSFCNILQLIIYKALLKKGFLFVCHFAIAKPCISEQVSFLSEIEKSSQVAYN